MAVKNSILMHASTAVIFFTTVGKILRSDHTATSFVLSGGLYTV
jgi:hypothetical protein